ncbi:MAG TPA: DNA polymerase/3'-5' exonuclease PolX [Gemmatimonadales bacterium]|nr:DNA polymerase/3'-5' exonuclease PolX [Gemmatimonadales bacterium]
MSVENAEVARLFRELADLLEIQGANPFRVRAYRTAARTVEELPEPVEELAQHGPARLAELPGIGEDLAGKILEIVRTGSLGALEDARRQVPRGLTELMGVRGLGPKRARALYEALGIKSLRELERAARARRIREVPGFGARTEEKILEELAARAAMGSERRVLRAVAAQYGEAYLEYLRAQPGVRQAEIAGSFRRCRETVGDLDILVDADPESGIADRFLAYPEVAEVLARGPTRCSVRLRSGLQVDLRVVPSQSYGAGLHYFTGSKPHNIAVRRLGQQRGLKINEYGVFRGRRQIGGRTEDEVFRAVGLPWIPPELREDRGELEAAREGRLPRLVQLADIRGDLQLHTTESDGRDTLEAMAEAAEGLGYEYVAVTDHSPALRMVRGLDRAGFRRQMRRIERLNARLTKLTVLKGAEVDIRPDGSLDLDDDTLRALDLVVASVHSKLDLPERQQTERVLKALSHGTVDVLAHPTGRLLGRRPPMRLDLDRVFRAAADHGTLLEVNAQPERLDLDDLAVRAAVGMGLKLVISTDAHATVELRFMRWGVDQARRGWARPEDVANTRPLEELLAMLHARRR